MDVAETSFSGESRLESLLEPGLEAAARRLGAALGQLETGLADRQRQDAEASRLEAELAEARALAADRQGLADQLDKALARAQAAERAGDDLRQRLGRMARESLDELGTLRGEVEAALGGAHTSAEAG